MARLTVALAATRPQFLTASALPVLVGTAWGARTAGALDLAGALLALAATALLHAASNVYNDVSDDLLGTDRINSGRIGPFTGGSRVIQDGLLSVAEMRRLAGVMAAGAVVAGTLLALRAGAAVVAYGVAGAALGAAYSLPGLRLSGRGLGEAAIAAAFGVLPVGGAYWLQSGRLDGDAVLLSLPLSAWVAAIIIANEIPDADADAATGKRTLAVRLGPRTPALYLAVQCAGLVAACACAARGLFPEWMLLVPAVLFVAAVNAAGALAGSGAALRRALATTLVIHGAGSAWLGATALLT